ncbi:MAG: hypothetical protein WC450_00565 [Candidatus Omnitrophota bacterium]|jgi:hypothetical protein
MNAPVYNNITTLESLGATIQNDYQVLTWFSLLLNTPAIRSFLTARNDGAKHVYERFSRLSHLQSGMTGLLGGIVLAAGVFPQDYIWGGMALSLFAGILSVHRKKTAVIRKLALILIPDNFDQQSLGRQTLYQITEFYARKYGIPSLIEVINIFTRAAQDTAVVFLMMLLLFIPFPSFSWGSILAIIFGYPLAQHALIAYILRGKTRRRPLPPGHMRDKTEAPSP